MIWKGPHAQKGKETREINNRHMGTLSISVHEDKRVQSKPSSPEVQTQEVGRTTRGHKVTQPQLKACGG